MVHIEEMEVDSLDIEAMDLSTNDPKGIKRKVSILDIYTHKVQKLDSRRASLSEAMANYQQSLDQKFKRAAVDVDPPDLELVLSGHLRKDHWNQSHSEALLRLMKRWQDVAINYARSDKYFTSLQTEDQAWLIHRNANLLSEYCLSRYISADSGREQLTWICGMTEDILRQYHWHPIGKINFRLIKDQVLPSLDPEINKNFLNNLKRLKGFSRPFEPGHTSNLANLFLYNTDLWRESDLLALEELERIRNIEEFSQKVFLLKCDYAESTGDLVKSLRFQQSRHDSNNAVLPVKAEILFESDFLTAEESNWLTDLRKLYFENVCRVVKFDAATIEGLIDLHIGKCEKRHETMFKSFAIMNERNQRLIEEGLKLSSQGINPVSYNACISVTGAKSQHLPSSQHKLHFLTQSSDLSDFSAIQTLPARPFLMNYEYLRSKELQQTWKIVEGKVASFVANTDVYLLVLLNVLLRNPINPAFQKWQHASKRLLLKKLRSLCGRHSNVEALYDAFSNDSHCLLNIIQNVMQEGNTDPSLK